MPPAVVIEAKRRRLLGMGRAGPPSSALAAGEGYRLSHPPLMAASSATVPRGQSAEDDMMSVDNEAGAGDRSLQGSAATKRRSAGANDAAILRRDARASSPSRQAHDEHESIFIGDSDSEQETPVGASSTKAAKQQGKRKDAARLPSAVAGSSKSATGSPASAASSLSSAAPRPPVSGLASVAVGHTDSGVASASDSDFETLRPALARSGSALSLTEIKADEPKSKRRGRPLGSKSKPRAEPAPPQPQVFYVPRDNEVPEDEMELPDEFNEDLEADEIPCRDIDDFAIYDTNGGNALVLLDALEMPDTNVVGSGIARSLPANWNSPDADDDADAADDEDDEDGGGARSKRPGVRVTLSSIFNWELSNVESGTPVVWIRTQFAYYRLATPCKEFETVFRPFYHRLRVISTLIRSIIADPTTTLDQFLDICTDPEATFPIPSAAFGRNEGSASDHARPQYDLTAPFAPPVSPDPITREDVETNIREILDEITGWVESVRLPEANIAILSDLEEVDHLCRGKKSAAGRGRGRGSQSKAAGGGRSKASARGSSGEQTRFARNIDANKAVLMVRNLSTITNRVAKIAGNLFGKQLVLADQFQASIRVEDDGRITLLRRPSAHMAVDQPGGGGSGGNGGNGGNGGGDGDPIADADGSSEPSTDKRQSSVASARGPRSAMSPHGKSTPGKRGAQSMADETANSVEWGGDPILTTDAATYYTSAVIDTIDVSVGDFVLVAPDKEIRAQFREQQGLWCGRICYMFEEDYEMFAHVRWFIPGACTLLMETASKYELFMIDECSKVSLWSILSIAAVRFLDYGEPEPEPTPSLVFFYRYWYDMASATAEDAELHDTPLVTLGQRVDSEEECRRCAACDVRDAARRASTALVVDPKKSAARIDIHDDDDKDDDDADDRGDNGSVVSGRIDMDTDDAIDISEEVKDAEAVKSEGGEKTLPFRIRNVTYHMHDYVYIVPVEAKGLGPYQIGQITSMTTKRSQASGNTKVVSVVVSMLERFDVLAETLGVPLPHDHARDEHHLVVLGKQREVSVQHLEGVCWVQHIDTLCDPNASDEENASACLTRALDEFKDEPDCFWVRERVRRKFRNDILEAIQDPSAATAAHGASPDMLFEAVEAESLPECKETKSRRRNEIRQRKNYIASQRKLVALDIFSGCGGLSIGMDSTSIVETKHAVEFSSSAAKTFAHNFPDAVVHNQCANLLLARAIAMYSTGNDVEVKGEPAAPKRTLEPVKDFQGRPLVDLPPPGSIDFIFCGPPCQGFSGINRHKKADDVKNSLVATSLSYVEFYKPDYFLLENVRGLINFRLGGKQAGENRIEGGIQMGVLKFILRTLQSMNYQTRFSVQQAGYQGLAQSRRRVFIWGAKRGRPLPEFPQPMYCFSKNGSVTVKFPDELGVVFNPVSRTKFHAPHPPVTVFDAISDLPPFEWVNPHTVYSPGETARGVDVTFVADPERTRSIRAELAASAGIRVQQFQATHACGFAGEMEQPYTRPRRSEFQRRIRAGSDVVHNHVTRTFNPISVERVVRVAMAPGADHHSLPEKLKPWCLSHPDSAAKRHGGWKGLFGRLDYDGHFMTTLTDMEPMGKQGTVIHPTQRRVLSVRECARAQGFPDWFVFRADAGKRRDGPAGYDNVKDMYRQVGNAVPPPLARSIGMRLLEALVLRGEPGSVGLGIDKRRGKRPERPGHALEQH
ncbi:hypothetical protein HK105_204315 [Polyrhizophydium stewartii]|uniref:DNA (cytosine-5-)-methyltransferase n=1 Tax=Polyrhizophydium stewartii TaxID=2732419 RepID=A0ABR4N9M7_9FUNG|nr:hypothetical protein HK105_007790 [Polyrhizophydium stewartii]